MKHSLFLVFTLFTASGLCAQSTGNLTGSARSVGGATPMSSGANLPVERVGPNDLLGITVYDSPELTRTTRVDAEGTIRLPMIAKHIKASGLYPEDLEKSIAGELVSEQIMVDPIVTVSVIEYRSRAITVVGAVRNPSTFQDTGVVTLLDAITTSGGLAESAGQEILVSRQETDQNGQTSTAIKRIETLGLLNGSDSTLNIALQSGDVVRVPEAGRFYVVGNVKSPGTYPIKEGTESSVMKAMALSQGLSSYWAHTAYIYRIANGSETRTEIPIPLKDILKRNAPDMPLMANDILYIPEASGRKATLTTLDRTLMLAASYGTVLLYLNH
jgi:polysaccharide biosynthesis/export protein